MWRSLLEIFGPRWTENNGNDPCGTEKRENRRVHWLEEIGEMSLEQLAGTLQRIRRFQKPNDYWLPDLPAFLNFAGKNQANSNAGPTVDAIDRAELRTWVTRACDKYCVAQVRNHPSQISEASLAEIKAASKLTADQYNSLMTSGEISSEPNQTQLDEVLATLAKRLKAIKIVPPTPEELEQIFRRAGHR